MPLWTRKLVCKGFCRSFVIREMRGSKNIEESFLVDASIRADVSTAAGSGKRPNRQHHRKYTCL